MALFRRNPKGFFSRPEEKQIIAAIRESEKLTSGEIRVHLEDHFHQHDVDEVEDRAWQVFHQLEMGETQLRNGVLIYLALEEHKFAVIADEGINVKVPENFWDHIVADMEGKFKEGHFAEGIIAGIQEIGSQLRQYFPRTDTDQNELPDDISYGS